MNGNNNNNNYNSNSNKKKNVNSSKLKTIIKSKGFVTAMCGIIAVLVLIVGYNMRIRNATQPVSVPVAAKRLTARHLITEEDIRYIEIPNGALSSAYYGSSGDVIGTYVNYDTTIPEGSMFYVGSVIDRADLPDEALMNVPDGEILYYFPVNLMTTFTNSILPGRYIDIYVSTSKDDKALVGKLLENVKVLQVKTADGRNVFEDSEDARVPSIIMFSLPEDQHLMMRGIETINNFSISPEGAGFATIELFPVPTKAFFKDGDKAIQSTVSSQYLQDYIKSMIIAVQKEITVPDDNGGTTGIVIE